MFHTKVCWISLCLLLSLTLASPVVAEGNITFKGSLGLTVEVASTVPLGGKVVTGTGAQFVTGSGSCAVYYTGFERDRGIVHLRTRWSWGPPGAAPLFYDGNQELAFTLNAGLPTRILLAIAPSRPEADNLPTIELEVQGVDDFQQLIISGASNFKTKADKK